MIGIDAVVYVVLYLLVVGAVFGLLFWLTVYIEREFPSCAPFPRIARIILVVLTVLVLIGILLGLVGHPVIRF